MQYHTGWSGDLAADGNSNQWNKVDIFLDGDDLMGIILELVPDIGDFSLHIPPGVKYGLLRWTGEKLLTVELTRRGVYDKTYAAANVKLCNEELNKIATKLSAGMHVS